MGPSRRRVIRIDGETYRALDGFRQVASEVIGDGEHVEIDTVVGLALRRGLDALLRDIVGGVGEELLLKTLEGLAQSNPDVVYRFVVERMRAGDLDHQRFVDRWRGFLDADGGDDSG